MSTAQIYAGRGQYASPVEPTAPPTPSPAQERLNHHHQQFAQLLDHFVHESSVAHSVETLLNATFDRLSYQIGAELEHSTETPRTYTLHESELGDLYSGMRLAYYVVAIRERWSLIQKASTEQKGGANA